MLAPFYIASDLAESALLEKGDVLKKAIKRLHEKGFSLWLDDFGSGYSSLNSLKDYEFDVLKLDMRFLSSLTNNDKSKALIKSVIAMAKDIGMETVCEGVERKDQAEFLRSTNATRLQGYYYSKPIPYKDMEEKIINHEVNLSKDIKKGRKVF